ncbi:MAG: hypothetical protein ACXW1Y_10380 [Acidimicrobiia bacterium]
MTTGRLEAPGDQRMRCRLNQFVDRSGAIPRGAGCIAPQLRPLTAGRASYGSARFDDRWASNTDVHRIWESQVPFGAVRPGDIGARPAGAARRVCCW